MYAFIEGKVEYHFKDSIVINNQGIGYHILVANPYDFELETTKRIFVYQHVREDAILLFGFNEIESKDLFLRLISVKGIGPKTALGIMASRSLDGLVAAIENEDVAFLKKIPGIGPKAASQIVLDLKGKLLVAGQMIENQALNDACDALLALGYKQSEINKVSKILSKEKLTSDVYIKKALQLLLK